MITILALTALASAHDCDTALVSLDGVAQADLATALAAASTGASIEVCPGTHVGPFAATVPVNLVAVGRAQDTILDGDGVGSVLSLPGDSFVSGFTIQNGQADQGGGVRFTDAGVATIEDSTITANGATAGGGGLYVAPGGEVRLSGSVVSGNQAPIGGGIYADEGAGLDLDDSLIEGNTALGFFVGNRATPSSGGGVAVHNGWVRGGTLANNTAATVLYPWSSTFGVRGRGGGLYASGGMVVTDTEIVGNEGSEGAGVHAFQGAVTLDGVLIEGNQSGAFGGGAYFYAVSDVDVTDTAFHGNAAQTGAGAYVWSVYNVTDWTGGDFEGNAASNSGGGLFFYGAGTIREVRVAGNVAQRYGGGIATPIAPYFFDWSLQIEDAYIGGNEAVAFTGGGLDLGISAHLNRVTIEHNKAVDGGGVLLYGSTRKAVAYTMTDTVVRNNLATGLGGGIAVVNQAQASGSDTTIEGNRAASGGGVYVETDTTFALTDSELGDCPDNLPEDIWVDAAALAYVNYDEVDAVACDNAGCAPAPDARDCDDVGGACIDDSATVRSSAVLGDGVEVREEAEVLDRSTLGAYTLIDEEASIGHDATLGAFVQVCEESEVSDRAVLGDDVTIGEESSIGHDVQVGAGATLDEGVELKDRAVIGEGARLGEEVVVGHDASVGAGAILGEEVELGDRATVGEGAILGEEVVLMNDASVPAGAVVPDGTVVW